jgi:hypothetical protein
MKKAQEGEKKDLNTTITIIATVLKLLEWWRDWRKKK